MENERMRSLDELLAQGLTAGRYYDYENERPMWLQQDGRKLVLACYGSVIYFCPTCGEEHFRCDAGYGEDGKGWETCFNGHGVMRELRPENIDQANAIWLANNPDGRLVPVIERRRERIGFDAMLWADDGGRAA
jgi:hypothetical protein